MRLYSPDFSYVYHRVCFKFRQSILLTMTLGIVSCSGLSITKTPTAVLNAPNETVQSVGREVLENGGNAADAMAAMLMTGAVVFPSRMGLGASGICQVLDPAEGRVKTLDFLGRPMSFDRQIATPGLARGVYTLQNKYGRKRWNEIVMPAVSVAEKGIVVSDGLSKDILYTPGLPSEWKKLKKGDKLALRALAKTMRTLATQGAGVLYNGQLGASVVSQSNQIVMEDLKGFKASFMDSIDVLEAGNKTFFPNPSVLQSDAYMIWRCAQPSASEKKQKRAVEDMMKMENRLIEINGKTTGFGLIAADKKGLIVACSVSMGSSFGTGQFLQEGFFLGSVIPQQNQGAVFANFVQTNADVTDSTQVLVGVGDYALVDGMNVWASRCGQTPLLDVEMTADRKKVADSFAELVCEKGYPNQPSSCENVENQVFVYEKNN